MQRLELSAWLSCAASLAVATAAHGEPYVTNRDSNSVTVIDAVTFERTDVPVGRSPRAVGQFIGPAPTPLGGTVARQRLQRVVCTNQSTGQTVRARFEEDSWDCDATGLIVNPGEVLKTVTIGEAE